MERASRDHFEKVSLRDEHIHRYHLAAKVAQGVVVDCACGIGYASKLINDREGVLSYLGIDPSIDAIKYAKSHHSGENIYFENGRLEKNSCSPSSVDTFLMFETLEHTANPRNAIRGVRSCLKADGLLIGSVPSAVYESMCESTYGKNPYHLQRFTEDDILQILGEYFEEVRICSMQFVLGSIFEPVNYKPTDKAQILTPSADKFGIAGSIIFIAGSKDKVAEATGKIGENKIFIQSIPKVILDRDEVEPIRTAMKSMSKMIESRDEAIEAQAKMLRERWSIMEEMGELIRVRDEAIAKQTELLNECWSSMQYEDKEKYKQDGKHIRHQMLLTRMVLRTKTKAVGIIFSVLWKTFRESSKRIIRKR